MASASEMRVPAWLRVALAIACAPVLIGVILMIYRAGISAPVLIGGLVGPMSAAVWHCRRKRHST